MNTTLRSQNADAAHVEPPHVRTSPQKEPGRSALTSSTASAVTAEAKSAGESTNSVFSLFRRLLTQSEDDATSATKETKTSTKGMQTSSAPPSSVKRKLLDETSAQAACPPQEPLPFHSTRQHRLKVAVVGESESGRTTLSKSCSTAAEHKTYHPLVVSGQAATLKMESSVLSVQTYDITRSSAAAEYAPGIFNFVAGPAVVTAGRSASPARGDDDVLEVTVVDSGPAPLSDGAGSLAILEADVILLCFPLYGIKQVVPLQQNESGGGGGLGFFRATKPTEAFIHSRDYQLLTTLLTLLSTRCGSVSPITPSSPSSSESASSTPGLPFVFLVGTFQDMLKDASVAASHTILRALQRLCDRVRQRSPAMLPVADVFAVSATQATAVALTSDKQFDLKDWWRQTLLRAASARAAAATAAAQSSRRASASGATQGRDAAPSHAPFISLPLLRHLLAHPNRLQALHAGVRQIFNGRGSPRLLDVSVDTPPGLTAAFQETASAATRAEDTCVTSLVVDFITQLKARKRVWMLPLPKLWRVAFALGMQTREHLYLVLRQMEATGELTLLGRALSYTQESRLGACGPTNETVCLNPALLRASYSILYVYADWVTHRQRRHVRRCLRNVSLEECAARDPKALAARGAFSLPLLRRLAAALNLKTTTTSEAAELIISALVGSDVGYLASDTLCALDTSRPLSAASFADPSSSFSPAQCQDPLQPPASSPLGSHIGRASARSDSRETTAVSPLRAHTLARQPAASSDALMDHLSPASSNGGDYPASSSTSGVPPLPPVDLTASTGFSPNVTVAELTSLFLLGELTSSAAVETDSAGAASPPSSSSFSQLGNASFDPVRAAMQRTNRSASPSRPFASPDDHVVLVVPSLQPSTLCPDAVTRYVASCARRTSVAAVPSVLRDGTDGALRSSTVLLRVDPFPYDLMSLLTCRFASVALRVERACANAVLLSFNVAELLHPSADHLALSHVRSPSAAKQSADGCCFLLCAPPSDETISCAAVLRLVCFANSSLRVARLQSALCTELRMFLLQRLPGMTIAPEPLADRANVNSIVDDQPLCRNVEEFIQVLRSK